MPVLSVFLAFFFLPIPLSMLALGVWMLALFVAQFVASYALGKLTLERAKKTATPLGALAVGLVLLHLVGLIPFLGGLVALVATVFGLGGLFLAAREAATA